MGALIFVGLGLAGTRDLTLRALDALRSCDTVFAEFYTSHLVGASPDALANDLGVRIEFLGREGVESGTARILDAASRGATAFVTAGDPMTATTHQELRRGALARGIPVRIVHGVSIQVAAAGAAGLQSYKFGRTTTLVFPEPNYRPTSPYDAIAENQARGLHTLVLLDLRADEGRYMTAAEGARLLLEVEAEKGRGVVGPGKGLVACARVGSDSERIVYAPAEKVAAMDLGPPLHCLVVPGTLHFAEAEMLERARPAAP